MTKYRLSKKRILLTVFLVFSLLPGVRAQFGSLDQYKMELGVLGGTSFYIGDANPTKLFNHSQLAYGGFVRFNLNPRWAIKAALTRAEVAGDTRDYKNKYPGDVQADFERKFWDMGVNLEFNFMDYGLPPYMHERKWFSPYVFIGAGLTTYHDDMEDGQRMAFNLPFGLGVKFKIKNRINLGLEWSMHTLFMDNFDVVDEDSKILDNPYEFDGISKIKNNDRYSVAKAFVSIDLFKRKHCR